MDQDALRAVLAAHPWVRLAVLFGSTARGTDRPDSDIDIAVLGDGDLLALASELSLASGKEVHTVDADADSYPLLRAIVREGEILYAAAPGIAGAWWSKALSMVELDAPFFDRMTMGYLKRVAREGLGGHG